MDEKFVAEVKIKLQEQRESILKSLADQTDEMKSLIKPIESGDEADVASDVIDRTMLDALGAQDSLRLQQIDAALERIRNGKYGICLGTSSACQTNKYSHVLSAMNIDENYKLRVIRLSTSDYTTLDECKYLIDKIKEMIEEYKI